MTKAPKDDPMIERMLDDLARAPVPDTPDDLMARVLADGQAMLPPPVAAWRLPRGGARSWTALAAGRRWAGLLPLRPQVLSWAWVGLRL
ncbi:hypothetical protein ACERZ8_12270 [Tateyamaria armeniaca]|uniref:Uncharacterized protein n=1 Tax=Tateyamaria armeniaca TaxID=2518930 RepID=A0ABW8UTZ8_9RHOB